MELVGGVADALPVAPADRGELVGAQRLGHQHVVPDGDGVRAQPAHQRREGVGRQRDVAGPDARPAPGTQQDGGSVAVQRLDRGVFVDADAQPQAGRAQPPGEPGRIDERGVAAVPHTGEVGRRVDLGAQLVAIEVHHVVAEALGLLGLLAQPLDLVGLDRHRQLAGSLEAAVDAVAGHRRLDRVEVLPAQPVECRHLVGEAREPVGRPVGERGDAEPAVASGRRPPGVPRLEQHDVARRVGLLGLQRGPQPGEAAADDREVGTGGPVQSRSRHRTVRGVQPEADRPRLGEGLRAHTIFRREDTYP